MCAQRRARCAAGSAILQEGIQGACRRLASAVMQPWPCAVEALGSLHGGCGAKQIPNCPDGHLDGNASGWTLCWNDVAFGSAVHELLNLRPGAILPPMHACMV